jgi:[ribosomal protein S18]-alanine N-acetyltransferase
VRIEIRQMREAEARQIASWHYEPPYSFYDWEADAGDLALLLSKEHREGRYFSAFAEGELVGFFEFGCEHEDVVIGLGLRPDLTGHGHGLGYLEAGMAFARDRFGPSRFRLAVATFNERAIRVYERAGFHPVRTYDHETNGSVYPFLEMTRPA